jgi:arsenate reductase
MEKTKVLFVCVHNSARSQMAEALLNHFYGDQYEAESAGLEPGKLNPVAAAAMEEMGIDISQKGTQDVFELYKAGKIYTYVITVCDESSGERCPLFPGVTKTLHWSFDDPAAFTGSEAEKLRRTIQVRDQINAKILAWVHELNP